MNKIYGVVFNDNGKRYYYKSEVDYQKTDLVIINTERGEQLAKIVEISSKDENNDGEIVRIATEKDYDNFLNNLKDADKALKKAKSIAKELNLDMKILNAYFNLDRSQLLFNFTADGRVDFREMAKKLASNYHTRIELRQIGARDKAKEISGIGICGGKLCCSRFLKSINTITMNMAKNQNLALNPSKINGACGRLLCCLQYEDDNYLKCSEGMPSMGDIIKTPNGEGPVVGIDILNRRVKVLVDGEKIDYDITKKSEK